MEKLIVGVLAGAVIAVGAIFISFLPALFLTIAVYFCGPYAFGVDALPFWRLLVGLWLGLWFLKSGTYQSEIKLKEDE